MVEYHEKLICLTRHGEQRAKERLGLRKRTILKRVQWIYEHGIRLGHPIGNHVLSHSVESWLKQLQDNLRYDWHPEVVLYGHHAYLYSEYNFVTVVPAPNRLLGAIDNSLFLWRAYNETKRTTQR